MNEYNEISYAKEMLANGFIGNRKLYELNILAKYYVYMGLKPSQVKSELVEFCKENFENFNEVKYFDKINSILINSKRTKIRELGAIQITNSDIDYATRFKDDKRLMFVVFVLLVIKKIRTRTGQSPFLNIKYSKFAKMCGIHQTKQLYPILKTLSDIGIVKICRTGNCEILIDVKDGIDVFSINDIDNAFAYLHNFLYGQTYIECSMCGGITKKIKNKLYCSRCAIVRKRKMDIDRILKNRKTL